MQPAHDPSSDLRRQELVVVIDDHMLIATALRDLIAMYSLRAEVRAFTSLKTALQVLRCEAPLLVIVDLGLPDCSPAEAVALARSAAPKALVAVLSGNEDAAQSIPEIRSGAVPFVHKGLHTRELTKAVRALLDRCGLSDTSPTKSEPDLVDDGRLLSLSPKQREILRLLATGRTNAEIGRAMNLSGETVKSHLHDIFLKLQVKNRTQAVTRYQTAWQRSQHLFH
jgi:DNA-binding NarL/FixJ family response regulator